MKALHFRDVIFRRNSDVIKVICHVLQNLPPPQVFISYQWDKQPQIKALYERLTDLGYSCWLDIMQMGGGDSLYDLIDRGLRNCKVILSCVTPAYARSANCR